MTVRKIKSIGDIPYPIDVGADALSPLLTAGAALGITGNDAEESAWLQRVSTSDGPTTIRSIHGNTIVQDGELVPVNMEGIATEDADGNPLQTRTIPAGILRSAGTVYDEQTETERTVRVGEVDLGTVNWYNDTGYTVWYTTKDQLPAIPMYMGGLTCSKYQWQQGQVSPSTLPDGCISVTNSAATPILRLNDSSFAGYTAAQVKAALSGVMLHYELSTPTVTPHEQPINMTYRTEQGGTERVMVPTGELSAPPTIATAQGYTAESLRDAALSTIAPVENGLASTNYGVGSYLVHGGQLCKVTTAIATGESITIGTNVTATTVMAEVIALTQ